MKKPIKTSTTLANNVQITGTREIGFCYGHRLVGHEGKCQFFHGHNVRLLIEFKAKNQLDSIGRIVDFSEIKKIALEWIDLHWDHNMILNKQDLVAIDFFTKNQKKRAPYLLSGNPTAENLVQHFLEEICPKLFINKKYYISKVTFFETDSCQASAEMT